NAPTTAAAIAMTSRAVLPIAELVEPILVDPEVVRKLMKDGHADLLLERRRIVAEVLHERPAVDRDPRGQVLRLVEQAVEIRLLRVLLLDDDGDVLEPARELWRKRVERRPHVLLERGHR